MRRTRKSPRLRRFGAAILVCLAGAALYGWLWSRRDPYAFLSRFHPKRIDVDIRDILPKSWRVDNSVGDPKLTLLVFRYRDAPSVLAAMRRELTPARGFRPINLTSMGGSAEPPYDKDVTWEFVRGFGSADGDRTARYSAGYAAADAEQLYAGTGRIGGSRNPACIVLIAPAESGFEKIGAKP
ncbi:MAG TPA: hypothetical protein VMI31_12885 [Fimbriimonadaceae bacterium]|nr:hypothetical protein [Fimbriimonadaceae bacterium]